MTTGLPLSRQKNLYEIADNIPSKGTFINTKSASYEVWVPFHQMTKVNSNRSMSKSAVTAIYDIKVFVTSILLRCDNQIFLTTEIP